MRFRMFKKVVIFAGMALGLVACGGGGSPAANNSGIASGVTTSPNATLQYVLVTPNVPPTLSKGLTQQFVATGYYSDGTTQNLTSSAAWSSSAPSVASIGISGQAAGVTIGSTTITTSVGGVTSIPVALHVMQATLTSIAITSTNPSSLGVGQHTQYNVTGTYSDGFTQDITPSVSWYGTTSVADVSTMFTPTPGLTAAVAPGFATVTASVDGFTASASLTVTNAYSVGGTLSHLPAGSSVTLSNTITDTGTTTTDSVTLTANGSFYFPTALTPGSIYKVVVSSSVLPAGYHACTVVNDTGTLSATAPTPVISLEVVCGAAVGTFALASGDGIAVDTAGNVYVADSGKQVIQKITPSGLVSTLAGTAGAVGYADGPGASAMFWQPTGVAVDTAGNVYVADRGNNAIRKIALDGTVSTLAGSNTRMFGFADGTGVNALFDYPQGVAVDTAGNVFVADTSNNAIRKITPAGVVSTIAGGGNGVVGSANGAAASATFNWPTGVAVDTAGNIYVADNGNHLIRKIAAGQVTTLAGSITYATTGGFANGTGTSSMFNSPKNVAVDGSGNVYVSDLSNKLIRFITQGGVVTTLAGMLAGTTYGSKDGPALSASFLAPIGVAVDANGNVFVSDGNIRKITP